MVETTEPTSGSDEGSSSAAATFVPNPLPPLPTTPLLPATQLTQPLSSAVNYNFYCCKTPSQTHKILTSL